MIGCLGGDVLSRRASMDAFLRISAGYHFGERLNYFFGRKIRLGEKRLERDGGDQMRD